MVDLHAISLGGLYVMQLAILYKIGRLEGRLRALEYFNKPAESEYS